MARTKSYVLILVLLVLGLSSSTRGQSDKKTLSAVLIDNSGSMRSQFARVTDLGDGIVRHVYLDGTSAVFSFEAAGNSKDRPPLALRNSGWTSNPPLLRGYVRNLRIVPGQTTLFDAIHSMAEQMNAKANIEKESYARKILVLITDGEDRVSRTKSKTLLAELKQANIQVYAVGLVQELDGQVGFIGKNPHKAGVKFLRSVAESTGGRVIFPKTNKDDVDSLLRELFAGK
jgi:hypothetical protein